MTQHFYDFSGDTIDQAPNAAIWTPYGMAGTYWTGKVQNQSVVKYVDMQDNSWGNGNCGYYLAEFGAYAPGESEQIEITCQFRIPSTQATSCFAIRWDHYYFQCSGTTNWWMTWDNGWDYVAGTGATGYTVTPNTWWWMRVQRSSTGVFKMRLWEDGVAEGGSWLITSSADTHYTSGWFGFNAQSYTCLPDIRAFGVGILNSAAPVAAVGGGGATNKPYGVISRARRSVGFRPGVR